MIAPLVVPGPASCPGNIRASLTLVAPTQVLVRDKTPSKSRQCAIIDTLTSAPNTKSPTLVHFPECASSKTCHLKETDIGEPVDMWHFCLIGHVAGRFPSFASPLNFISKNWKHKTNFTMHDSGWLIFAFPSEIEMLDIMGGGPYYVFGWPLILKIMSGFLLILKPLIWQNCRLG